MFATIWSTLQLRTTLMTLGLAVLFFSSTARAGVTLYTDQTAFNTAAGSTRQINFGITDSGAPPTEPPSDQGFAYLQFGGACFQNEQSYYDQAIYNFPGATTTVSLGPNTYAAGTRWSPSYVASQNFTVNVSVGGLVSQFILSNSNTAWQHTFLGFVSDKPINWISFSLDNAYFGFDYFIVSASGGSVVSCPLPACTGPAITAAAASTGVLWPPNHNMIPETITVTTSGGCGAVSCQITSVSSNEPVDDRNGDWVITGPLTISLRADRLGTGTGRIYTIALQCTDGNNNSTTKTVTVIAPHDQGNP